MIAYQYEGHELEVFEHATNWKSYFNAHLAGYVRGRVLEVGSGLGATTRVLCDGRQDEWLCLEPDPQLAEGLRQRLAAAPLAVQVEVATLADLPGDALFDTILYIDVLEHIEEDRREMERAAAHLKPGGRIVVLSPAHQWLFTPFDKAIGHFRRYSARTLKAVTPPGLQPECIFYLDSVGMLASLANRLLLRSAHPGLRQILFWDRVLVRSSRLLDPLLGYRVGKSVIGIWRAPARKGPPPGDAA
jgi:2-polyprenyl-3-methyl-5-hydroxy-6-metoxy-1,4-benzoquinol methylase